MKTKYIPAKGGKVTNQEDANTVGVLLSSIEKEEGHIKPQTVIDRAKPKASPIHGYFTWDNNKAANEHRLNEARWLIKSVRVIREDDAAKSPRAFVAIPVISEESNRSKNVYVSIESALGDKDTRDLVLQRAWAELKIWENRYHHLEEFAGIIKTINRKKAS